MTYLTDILALIGTSFYLFIYLTQIYDIYNIYKTRKDIDKFPFMIYIVQIINCYFWYEYCYLTDITSLMIWSLLGVFLNILFLIVYILCKEIEKTKKKQYILYIFLVYLIFLIIFKTLNPTEEIYGFLANISSISMTLSSAQNILKFFKTKDVKYFAINFCFVFFFNCLVWILYTILKGFDLYIFLSSFVGFVVFGFQIILYFIYKKESLSKDFKINNENENNRDGLLVVDS